MFIEDNAEPRAAKTHNFLMSEVSGLKISLLKDFFQWHRCPKFRAAEVFVSREGRSEEHPRPFPRKERKINESDNGETISLLSH